jgi:hypothetical protein
MHPDKIIATYGSKFGNLYMELGTSFPTCLEKNAAVAPLYENFIT